MTLWLLLCFALSFLSISLVGSSPAFAFEVAQSSVGLRIQTTVDVGAGQSLRASPELQQDSPAGRAPTAEAITPMAVYDPSDGIRPAPETTLRDLFAPNTTGSYTGGGVGRMFTHFTDEAGAVGITGTRPLAVGESVDVGQLTFGKGQDGFQANAPGDIFVTDLPPTASSGQLNGIGVFGNRQQYAVTFSEADAFASGVRVQGTGLVDRGICTVPGGCTTSGTCTVMSVW